LGINIVRRNAEKCPIGKQIKEKRNQEKEKQLKGANQVGAGALFRQKAIYPRRVGKRGNKGKRRKKSKGYATRDLTPLPNHLPSARLRQMEDMNYRGDLSLRP